MNKLWFKRLFWKRKVAHKNYFSSKYIFFR